MCSEFHVTMSSVKFLCKNPRVLSFVLQRIEPWWNVLDAHSSPS